MSDFKTYIRAGSTSLSKEEMSDLSACDDYRVRRRIAEHPSAWQELLEKMASDSHADVRVAVSEHPATSSQILQRLSEDFSDDVRFAMASNHNLPVAILESFIKDDNPFVVRRAEQTLKRINPSSVEFVSFTGILSEKLRKEAY